MVSRAFRRKGDSHQTREPFLYIQGVSERALQLYFKCYCVAELQKRLHLKAYKLPIVHGVVCMSVKCERFRNTRHTVTFGIPL
jgi:hypothetical protein